MATRKPSAARPDGRPDDGPIVEIEDVHVSFGDKKVLRGRIRLVLLRELGRATVVDDYAEQALDATLQAHFG